MDRLRRLLPALGAMGVLAILALIIRLPVQWPLFSISAALLVMVISFLLHGLDDQSTALATSWVAVAVPLVILCLGTGGLLLFLTTSEARQWLLVATASLAGLSWASWWRYSWDRERYHPEELENILLAVELLGVWTLTGLGYRLLLDPTVLPAPLIGPVYPLATVIVVIAVALLQYFALWNNRYPRERVWPFSVVLTMLMGEFFWVLTFLPHAPTVKAFVVAVAYYAVSMLGRAHLDQTLSRTVVRRYVGLIAVIMALVLVTAQWVV